MALQSLCFIVALFVICYQSVAFVHPFHSKWSQKSSLFMDADYSALEKKLLSKKEAVVTKAAPVVNKKTAVPETKAQPKVVQQKVSAPAAPKVVAPVAKPAPKVAAPEAVKVVSSPAPVVQKKIVETKAQVAVPPPSSSLSDGDFALGVTFGLAPYLLIPALLAPIVSGLIKKPKPLPVRQEPAPKVKPYSKPLGAGFQEGLQEFFSSKRPADINKGLQLSTIGFGSALALTAVLFGLSGTEVKESKESAPAPAVKKVAPAPAPAPAPKVEPAPAPAPKIAPAPAPAPKVEPAPAPAPKVEPAPAPAPKVEPAPAPAPKVEPAPVPAPKVEPAPAPAPKVEPAPAPAPKVEPAPAPKVTPAPAPAPKAVSSDEVVEVYKGTAAAGEKLDLDALKALRVSGYESIANWL